MNELIQQALTAREFSRAKYSGFTVGAALKSRDGRVFTGCNVESSSYGLTICAERVALVKALSEGVSEFSAIAIVGPHEAHCPPCGACRQLLYDYAPDIAVIMTDGTNEQTISLRDLLPLAFEENQLKKP
jgi:cytidine deaminase